MAISAAKQVDSFKCTLTIRDKAHFKKVVNWLNTNIGKGKEHWTASGKILKKLRYGKSVSTTFFFANEEDSRQVASFVALL